MLVECLDLEPRIQWYSRLTLKDHHHLVVSVCRGVAGEPDGGPGQGAAAGQHEWGFQLVLLHVAVNKRHQELVNQEE